MNRPKMIIRFKLQDKIANKVTMKILLKKKLIIKLKTLKNKRNDLGSLFLYSPVKQ